MALTPLPIDDFLPEVQKILNGSQNLVLSAAPGAGKTTRVPPFLTRFIQGKVLVLEPRRMAALASAHRVAEEQGWPIGDKVGYWVRFDPKFSKDTQLIFLTEALLARRLLKDPELKDVGAVVLDEFHERSLHTDLALGLLKELQSLSRPDLKIVVMSATLDAGKVSRYLDGAPVLEVPGLLHPMEMHYDPKPQLLQTGRELTQRVVTTIKEALRSPDSGDLLVFLPGVGEIQRVADELAQSGISTSPLHGRLSLKEQQAVLLPHKDPKNRRVILSTNIAESAVTVDGVATVIDSGLERVSSVQSRSGSRTLNLQRISLASARQRAGRSARQRPGRVFRLWNPIDERSMSEDIQPEILREDVTSSLLILAQLGIQNFQSFSWFDPPDALQLKSACELLVQLGALQKSGVSSFSLTDYGRRLLDFPLHPRLAHLVLESQKLNFAWWGVRFATLLQEPPSKKDVSAGLGFENDLFEGVSLLESRPTFTYTKTVQQLENLLSDKPLRSDFDPRNAMELGLRVFPDRLCRRRKLKSTQAVIVSGKGCVLPPESQVKSALFFIAVDLFEKAGEADLVVGAAIGLSSEFVEEKSRNEARRDRLVRWDDERGDFFAFESRMWRGLSLDDSPGAPPSPEECFSFLVEKCKSDPATLFRENSRLRSWLSRYELFKGLKRNELPIEWIEACCFGERSWQALTEKDWTSILESLLPPEELRHFRSSFPTQFELPSGKQVPISYRDQQPPLIECKIQELFGLSDHPLINGQPVSFQLLGPNHRPVQITSDIPRFWQTSYPEIRKELRARYPKHYWPENPLEAEPSIINPNRKK